MTADRWSDLLALLAGIVGLTVVIRTWPRPPRRTQTARLRHPSTPPPVGVTLETAGQAAHWRVATPPGALTTAVDIVTWRPVTSDEWRSEPIIDPIMLAPGDTALLPLEVEQPSSPHLVVVAWTVKHPAGDVQGSRTLTVSTTTAAPTPAPVLHDGGWLMLVVSALLAGLLVVLILVSGWRLFDGDDSGAAADGPLPVAATETTTTTSAPPAATASTVATTTSPPTPTSTSPRVATTTIPTTSPTSPATTTAPATSSIAPASTTDTSTTDTSTTSTSVPAGTDRRIDIRGRVEDCRFGADCVIASFSAIGFASEGDYVCEFGDGSRFTFRYAGGGAIDACSTSGADPSITIEIDGVRSSTITRDEPDGPDDG